MVAGTLVATAALTGLVKKSVKAYSEFEQLSGGLEALFGKGSKEMQNILKTSENAYKTLTMSQNQYLRAFEDSYAIVNNGIGKNADAITYTNKMIQMSTDLYNSYGHTVEYYQSAINWALKGTYSYLDNLNVGIKGTKEGFIEAANKSGVLNRNIKNTSELTNDEILKVIEHYVQAAGALGRTQTEASQTIQGSMNMMSAAWNNLILGFTKDGADIGKLMDQFINSAGKFANNLIPVVERALVSVANSLPKLITVIAGRLPSLIQQLLPPLITSIGTLMTGLINALPKILNMLVKILPDLISMIIDLNIKVFNALIKILPTLIPQVISVILDGIMKLLDNIDLIIDLGISIILALIDGMIKSIPKLVEKAPIIIIKLVGALIRAFPKLAAAAIQIPMKLWTGIVKGIPTLIKNVPKIITKIVKELKNQITKFKDVGKNMAKGLWNGIKDMKDWVIEKVKGMGKGIVKGLKKALGIKSPSKEFAIIGRFSMLGYQEGLEKMKPQIDKAINSMFNLSPSMTGTMNNTISPKVNVVNNVNLETDPLGQVVSKIKTFSGGAKNDYNYGYGG